MTIDVKLESLTALTEYVEDTLTEAGVPMKVIIKMNIAVDEIFSNIVKFSEASKVTVTCNVEYGCLACMVIADNGNPYNPLENDEPDITLSAEERDIGGLGIFMVKKSMTSMEYEYKDGKNILTLKLQYE